ncbi:MAG: HU family DNA-binding protein [bacterium]
MAEQKKPMTKAQIATHFSTKFALTKKQASDLIDEFAALAIDQAKKIGAFTLPGIAKITKVKRKARKGRNPATGQEIKIPAKTVAKIRLFKASAEAIVPPKKG